MAKTKHNHLLDTIDEIITAGKNKGILHLYTEDETFNGRQIKINGKNMRHFGTTGYLGLEQDERLKYAAIEAIYKYGTQFPLSKTYLSMGYYKELEECLFKMYNYPTLVTKNSTLGHIGVIPSIVRDEDAVILDHQVHSSVQNACQLLKPRGISVEIIRHNNLNMLEEKLKQYDNKYKKVWYMIDGVYSMYGDCAPLHDLLMLLDKYPQLYLYADDVHGMSWTGKNGTGYVLNEIKTLHPKMVLMGTLSKSFGASGAVVIFPEEELCRKVKTFGGPQTFSAQLEPASIAAATASAKIHLSSEIYEMQNELAEKVNYCNSLLKNTDIPMVEENNCPVFFIGTGLPAVGYNLVNRMMNEGFFVNLGIFPAVPVKNTGIRFTVSRHNHKEDIDKLVKAFEYHYPKALEDEKYSLNKVRKSFNLSLIQEDSDNVFVIPNLTIQHEIDIEKIKKEEWDSVLGKNEIFDWEGLKFLQRVYKNNYNPEENWDFDYFIIKNKNGKVILATFFTTEIWKDDMLAPSSVSQSIEEKRIFDPYYLTSKILCMGSLITEGNHLYLDKSTSEWKDALLLLFNEISKIQEKGAIPTLALRDFEDNDQGLKDFFLSQGFIKVDMPEYCIVEDLSWNNIDEYLNSLSSRSRKHLRADVIRYEKFFDIEVKKEVSEEELLEFYQLYKNVKSRNFSINLFDSPYKLFNEMMHHSNWEFLILKLKPEYDDRVLKTPVAISFNYLNNSNAYVPLLMGMNYEYLEKYQLYRQALFRMILRGKEVGANKVCLGFSASIEKRKFGARIIPKIAYIQTKDNFNLELMESISIKKAS